MAIVFFRTIIIFLTLLVSMRLMGKRQLGELELSELVVAVLISNVASHPLQEISISLMNGLLPIIILLCCELIISGLIVRSAKVRQLICGKPCFIITDGIINQREMKKNRFTLDELYEELRNQGVLDISTVKFAILETDGKLNIVLFPAEQPVTAGQMGIETSDDGYPVIIINNGRLMSHNLRLCGRDEKWLNNELKKRKLNEVKDVYLMTLNSSGQIYFLGAEKV